MKKTTITLQELLDSQTQQGLRATLEAVVNEKDQVKITPFLSNGGCQCHMGIKMSKEAIQSLALTGETHHCCGKTLQVVEVQFKKGAGISLSEVLQQLVGNVAQAHAPFESAAHHGAGPTYIAARPFDIPDRCLTNLENCAANAQDD